VKRSSSLVGIGCATLAASMLACNFPAAPGSSLSVEAIQQTMAAVTPRSTGSPPSMEATDLPSTPPHIQQLFPIADLPGEAFEYTTRPGDTLEALAGRFGLEPAQILIDSPVPAQAYLPVGLELHLPNTLGTVSPGGDLLPDGELVYSPAAVDFDVQSFVVAAAGYLSRHYEAMEDGAVLSGAAIVQKVADENSVNPRLLLALIEMRSGWVSGSPPGAEANEYPIGFRIPGRTGLYQELTIAAAHLNRGYYGWRAGTLVLTADDVGGTVRWNPTLNAGSVALLHLFALLSGTDQWMGALVGPRGFPALYQTLFGDVYARAETAGPVLSPDLEQPPLELPFQSGEVWSLTAGPHQAWTSGTPRGALDFSPTTREEPCAVSVRWVTASAPGLVVRAEDNLVALDLDGDGRESTGWVLLYYHLAGDGLIASGTWVEIGDPLGHPSCEGGRATGKHVHLARRYNGEWLPADGPVPFVLSGWRAVADERNYLGFLVRGEEQVTADSSGRRGSTIWR